MFVDTQSALRLFMVGSIKMPTGRIRIRLTLLLPVVRLYDSISNEILGFN